MALVRLTRRQPRTALPPFPSAGTFPAIPSFDDLDSRMSKLIERVFSDPLSVTMPESIGWIPAMDIVEGEKEFTLTAELPGLDEKNVDVSVEEGLLTIKGEKIEEKEAEKKEGSEDKKFYLYERNYGAFCRSFALPPNVDAMKVDAEFKKGVLTVHLPKTAEVKTNGRKVEIKTK